MERETNSDKLERLATEEERDYINRLLGAQGLYDASQDTFELIERPDDSQWIIRGLE